MEDTAVWNSFDNYFRIIEETPLQGNTKGLSTSIQTLGNIIYNAGNEIFGAEEARTTTCMCNHKEVPWPMILRKLWLFTHCTESSEKNGTLSKGLETGRFLLCDLLEEEV